jgi:biopolymer transport protein ExbB/TolQ
MNLKTKRNLLMTGMIVGVLLTLSPLIGLFGTAVSMTKAFNSLASSGISDPEVVSQSIGMTLVPTALGVALLPIGIVLFVISLILFLRQRPSSQLPLSSPPAR